MHGDKKGRIRLITVEEMLYVDCSENVPDIYRLRSEGGIVFSSDCLCVCLSTR